MLILLHKYTETLKHLVGGKSPIPGSGRGLNSAGGTDRWYNQLVFSAWHHFHGAVRNELLAMS